MNCPNCNVKLVMSDKKGIEIDYCPECRGIWLDKGELDKIIERSIETLPQQFNDYRDSGYYEENRKYDDDYYKRRRKKSFLGDLFDFD